jgi:NAD(P)-dependent dehydrogenase (short-subunit alcohol dehydrogenase family)
MNFRDEVSGTGFSAEELETCLRLLQRVADDPAVMNGHERFKTLVAKVHRHAKKVNQAARRTTARDEDRATAAQTVVVHQQLDAGPRRLPTPAASSPAPALYRRPRHCYVCQEPFQEVHFFYHRLCPVCAAHNWERRGQRADLRGRTALITGGRIKIGYETTLKLLRDGARVLVTTRFPHAAARRFEAEADAATWLPRLEFHGLDLRDIPAVERFARELVEREPELDILIHNAAQTVKRPLGFYRSLLAQEAEGAVAAGGLIPTAADAVLLEARPGYQGHLPGTDQFFPRNQWDRFGQPVDERLSNSWRQTLGEIGTIEVLEVLLVNSVAPFILTTHLLPAMRRSRQTRRFIVNVSGAEGLFTAWGKSAFHPHTNMAKAALNMLTFTAAGELAEQGIWMNSVDTGWVSDERPRPQAERERERQGFRLPLDLIDAASRIYDPIVRGIHDPAPPPFGQYFKDYAPHPW